MGGWGDHQGVRDAWVLWCEGQTSNRQPPSCQQDSDL